MTGHAPVDVGRPGQEPQRRVDRVRRPELRAQIFLQHEDGEVRVDRPAQIEGEEEESHREKERGQEIAAGGQEGHDDPRPGEAVEELNLKH